MAQSDEVFARIAKRMETIDPANRKVLHIYKFIITDNSGTVLKRWILDLKNVKLYESDDAAECTLTLTDELMVGIGNKTTNAKEALNADKIGVEGELELLWLLEPFLSELK